MFTRQTHRNRRLGFTLMEVLLVMAILVILGTIVVANFSGILSSSKEDAAKAQLQMFEDALKFYHLDVGQYPTADLGLEGLRAAPADANLSQKWRGPYAEKEIPADPWGSAFEYVLETDPQTNRPGFRIWSSGADLASGTEDDITVTSY